VIALGEKCGLLVGIPRARPQRSTEGWPSLGHEEDVNEASATLTRTKPVRSEAWRSSGPIIRGGGSTEDNLFYLCPNRSESLNHLGVAA